MVFRRTCVVFGTSALSPYAQALKHVALKGSVALGPSAKELELRLHSEGTLPADYRPPVQGQWDDTIERWTYAWQCPIEEQGEKRATALEELRQLPGFSFLLSFGQKLLEASPSKIPGSAGNSKCTRFDSQKTSLVLEEMTPKEDKEEEEPKEQPALIADSTYDEGEAVEIASQIIEEMGSPKKQKDAGMIFSENGGCGLPMMPAAEYSKIANVPAAYIDDGSELAAASKELGVILIEGMGLSYDSEGVSLALAALSLHKEEVRVIFEFVKQLGIEPVAGWFHALMFSDVRKGQVNEAMSVIEEMKNEGITPVRTTWHHLCTAFHRAGDYSAVQQIVDNMKAYANIEPDEQTYLLQLQALSRDTTRESSAHEAIQLFDHMENVAGLLPTAWHYEALMSVLCERPLPEMRTRCEELGKKMELLGMQWTPVTYLFQIKTAQLFGDLDGIKKLFGKMRNSRVEMNIGHLEWALRGHTQALFPGLFDYDKLKEEGKSPLPTFLEHMSICFGMYELIRKRGWEITVNFVNALLRHSCQTAILAFEYIEDDKDAAHRFAEQAETVWSSTYNELNLKKDVFSFEAYVALLSYQQRIDEAEGLFQEIILKDDMTPTRRTYESMIFMHLLSGEEGGTARALHYLEAMERAKIPIRASLLRKFVQASNKAGYRRDMKRRARRIMQAREEFMARKAENEADPSAPAHYGSGAVATQEQPEDNETGAKLSPLPISSTSTLAWWDRWKRETISKHELFETEREDGMPRGEEFDEKNEALRKMGIETRFPTKSTLPELSKQKLLPALKAEGPVSGALWALDGGELSYPKSGGGPEGWGARLWRDRQLMKKEYQKMLDGKAKPADFSSLGVGSRIAPEQLEIEASGAKNPMELDDYRRFPYSVYDDGTPKPASEFAAPVPASAELIWQQEKDHLLAPFMEDSELSLQSENVFMESVAKNVEAKVKDAIETLRNKHEDLDSVTGRGVTKKSKHDYLAKWREMYRYGTLEVPDEPLLRFGTASTDHKETLARTIRTWYAQNKQHPPTKEQIEQRKLLQQRKREERQSFGKRSPR